MDDKQATLLMHDYHTVEKAKTRMQDYLIELREPTKTFLRNQHKIEQNKCNKYVILMQTGSIIYESAKITHWIIRTPSLITTTTPHQYGYKVLVLNEKSGFFDTPYPKDELVTEQKCIEYVLKYQEQFYGFSWRENIKARAQLEGFHKQIEELGLIVGEEYSAEYQKQVETLHQNIRKELEIV